MKEYLQQTVITIRNKQNYNMDIKIMEGHIIDTYAEKQLSYAATGV